MASRTLVRDLMTVGVPTCPPETPIVEVARFLLDKGVEAMVVQNDEGHAIGVVGYEELVAVYGREDAGTLCAEDVMRDDVPQLPPDIPLATAAQMMRDLRVRAVFLMHHAGGVIYPAAMLTYQHLLRHLAAASDDDLKDMGIAAARQAPLEVFKQRREAARQRAQTHPEE
jgi:CBS domain-containing protein